MSYLVLARKYRPQSFDDLIGQGPITKTLKNAIALNKIAHAYLFSGPRGVGKTTSARIFAKALNCIKGPQPDPCGICQNCTAITNGSSLDVMEIDGASNRGIEDIRALRENVKFTPANARYKIYIIDEAHQITHDAFNALLKTLEEPPPHVIFILATTEPQRIPLTIISRCQRHNFRLIPTDDIFRYLNKVALQESLRINDEALRLIAKAAAGSLRDGLSIMDQVASFSHDEITINDVHTVLGYLPRELLNTFIEMLDSHATHEALKQISSIAEEGYDLHQFVSDVRECYRQLLIIVSGNELIDESQEQINVLKNISKKISMAEIIRNMRLLSRCFDEMRWSEQPRLVLELYTARLTEPYVDLPALVQSLNQTPTKPEQRTELSSKREAAQPETQSPASSTAVKKNIECAQSQPAINTATPSSTDHQWEQVLKEIEKSKPSLHACLKQGRVTWEHDVIHCVVGVRYAVDLIARHQEYIQKLIQKIFNKNIKVTIELNETIATEVSLEGTEILKDKSASPQSKIADEIVAEDIHHPEDDPGVQRVLDVFPGKIII